MEQIYTTQWDLSLLFKDKNKYQEELKSLQKLPKTFSKFVGNLNINTAIECLKYSSDIEQRLEQVLMYSHLNRDLDLSNAEFQAECEAVTRLLSEFSEATAFISPELSSLKIEELNAMKSDKRYEAYTVFIQEIIRQKEHILSKDEEELIANISIFSQDFKKIFSMLDNADLKFRSVKDEKGNKHDLNHAQYGKLLKSEDPILRKNAFKKYYKEYIALENTISSIYIASVKKDCTYAKLRKYESALDKALFADNVKKCVYENLIESVEKYLPVVHRYVAVRKEKLGLEKMHMYDMYVPLANQISKDINFERAVDIVSEALQPLGQEYAEISARAYKEGWVDVYPKKNKRSGAYSWGSYNSPPYLLLNFAGTNSDVFTLAHELGHSMHSFFSNRSQVFDKASYPIFIAEVASTVNEVLLLKHLIKNAKGDEKKFYLNYYLEMFRTTLFRQTMFAEFEYLAHQTYEKGKPLTGECLNKLYHKLNKKYYGKAVVHDKEIGYEWSRIPHFYSAFYVYKYATGLTSAITIANKILNESSYLDKYISFLSSGGKDYPVELLKKIDVDLETIRPFEISLTEFEKTLDEFVKC